MRKSGILRKGLAVALAAVMVFGTPIAVGTNTASATTDYLSTLIYSNDFESSDEGATSTSGIVKGGAIVGGGSIVSTDDVHGKVFKNVTGGTRQNYLTLTDTIFSDNYSTMKENGGFTISMDVNAKPAREESQNFFHSPIFSAYESKPFESNGVLNNEERNFLRISAKQSYQINDWAGNWSNPVLRDGTAFDENANNPTVYLDDCEWHNITITFDSQAIKYFVDGEVTRDFKWGTGETNAEGVYEGYGAGSLDGALSENGGIKALKYLCVGGNQNMAWSDPDPAFMFDNIKIYAKSLTVDEIKKSALSGISFTEASKKLQVGKSATLEVEAVPSFATMDKSIVTYKSLDENVAIVSDAGVVEGLKEGTATIVAQYGTYSATCEIAVVNYLYMEDFSQGSIIDLNYADSNQVKTWIGAGVTKTGNKGYNYFQFLNEGKTNSAYYGQYLNFYNITGTGSRSASGYFNISDSDLEDKYSVEFDLALNAGNHTGATDAQIALTNNAYNNTTGGTGGKINSGYFWSLSTQTGSENDPTAWTSSVDDKTITLVKSDENSDQNIANTWYHFKTDVSQSDRKAKLTITQGENCIYSTDISGLTENQTVINGLYILAGRGRGYAAIDNVKVYNTDSFGLYDIATYKASAFYAGYPAESSKVFAGWYSDSTCESPIAENVTTGVAYAKFLDSSFLTDIDPSDEVTSVACQKSKANTGYYRILLGVDSLDYSSVGFSVTYNEKTIDSGALTTVYNSITADGETYTAAGIWKDNGAKYIVPCVVKGITSGSFDVTPYWITKDGTKVEGATRTITVAA